MTNIKNQIRNSLTVTSLDQNLQVTAEFCLSEDFIGFQGHFPGRPVLPAVCMISAVLATVQKALGKNVALEVVKSAKFFAPVTPEERVRIEFKLDSLSEPREIRARLTRNNKKTAIIYLAIRQPD